MSPLKMVLCAGASLAPLLAPVAGNAPAGTIAIRDAVAAEARLPDDRARDPGRRPIDVLAFFGVSPGMKVIEFGAGGGYFTELLARVVGPEGHVIAQNPFFFLRQSGAEFSKRYAPRRLSNIVLIFGDQSVLEIPDNSVDAAYFIDTYHDFAYEANSGEELPHFAAALLADARRILKRNGIFGIVDHRAADSASRAEAATLHRIAESTLRKDLEAAGFRLDATAEFLANPRDDRSKAWFDDPQLKDNTDRLVHRYRSPD